MRRSRIITKQPHVNFNTTGEVVIFHPREIQHNKLSKRHIKHRAKHLATNCEKPEVSRCRSELSARWFSNLFSSHGDFNMIKNIDSPHHNNYNNYNYYDTQNNFYNSTVNYMSQGKGPIRSRSYLRYVKKRILASPNKCIKRLGEDYVNCLIKRKATI